MELHSHCVTFDRRKGRTGLKFGELLALDGLLIDTKFQVNPPVTSVVSYCKIQFPYTLTWSGIAPALLSIEGRGARG